MLGPDLLYRWFGTWCKMPKFPIRWSRSHGVSNQFPDFSMVILGLEPWSGAQESPNGARLGSSERGRDDNVAHRKKKEDGTWWMFIPKELL